MADKGSGRGDDFFDELFNRRVEELGDWRGEMLKRLRALIKTSHPDVLEEMKWRRPANPWGVPTWSHGGIVCTGETYRDKVKVTFARGAVLQDPLRMFNASLDGGTRRAIDIVGGCTIDESAFVDLFRQGVAANLIAKKS